MRSIVIFRFFSHLSLLFVYQCITFLPLIFRFSFYILNSLVTYLSKEKQQSLSQLAQSIIQQTEYNRQSVKATRNE